MQILFGKAFFNDWNCHIMDRNNKYRSVYIQDYTNYQELLQFIEKHNINLIIPTTYPQMMFLSTYILELNNIGVNVFCNQHTPNNINILDDKCNFVQFMQNSGLAEFIPDVIYVKHGEYNSFSQGVTEFHYPCIFKYAIGFAATGSKIYTHSSPFILHTANTKIKDFLIQTYIPGNVEFGGHFIVYNGKIIFKKYYQTINNSDNEFHIQKGMMRNYNTVTLDDNKESVFHSIFQKLNYTGFACANFKIYQDCVKIFEINPRMGGTFVYNYMDFDKGLDTIVDEFQLSSTKHI